MQIGLPHPGAATRTAAPVSSEAGGPVPTPWRGHHSHNDRRAAIAKYTDAQRAEALAALQANGGNLSATSRATGIPISTIKRWRDEPADPRLADLGNEKKADLAEAIETLAHRIVEVMPDRVQDANFQQLAVGLGIAVDKLRLLRGEATNIEEVRGSDAKHELAERLARLAAHRPQSGPNSPN